MTHRLVFGTALLAAAMAPLAASAADDGLPPRYASPSAAPLPAQAASGQRAAGPTTPALPGAPMLGAGGIPTGTQGAGVAMPQAGGGADTYTFSEGAPIDTQALDRSSEQMKGNYAPLERSLGIPLGMTQDAWSKPMQNMSPGQEAPGVVRFVWSPELVMPIRLRDNIVTMIRFPETEKLDPRTVVPGDGKYIEFAVLSDNVLAVRSLQSGIDTSLTVLGKSGNMYNFYLRAETYNTKKLTDMLVKVEAQTSGENTWQKGWNPGSGAPAMNRGWNPGSGPSVQPIDPSAPPTPSANLRPNGAPLAPSVPQQQPAAGMVPPGKVSSAPDAMLVPREKMIFNMTMYEVGAGDREIAPEYVYSDGVWTYLHYAKRANSMDQPVLYRVVDGIETRINTRTAGRYGEVIIAEAVGDFVLRSGAKTVCIKRNGNVEGGR